MGPVLDSRSMQAIKTWLSELGIGAQADITVIDPDALSAWDINDSRQLLYRELFQHQQMVSRSDGVVSYVFIHGEPVWEQGDFTPVLGVKTLGRALRAA